MAGSVTKEMAEVDGVQLRLRLAQTDDAAYIHGLRVNAVYNQHLSPVTGTVDDQRAWLTTYKAREAAGAEFYYIIERTDGTPCGTVRLYDITENSFTWGSWILDHNKPAKAALESAVLSFGVGFEGLGKPKAVLDVRRANTHATTFYRRFGAVETGQDDEYFYFELRRNDFMADRERLLTIINEQAEN